MKLLLLAARDRMGSRVLGAAAAGGHTVHLLCRPPARGLAWSRRAASVTVTRRRFDEEPGDALVAELNDLVRRHGIERVIPSDAPTTRFLIRRQADLVAPILPGPDLATFDALNDKWRFKAVIDRLGLTAPATRHFDDTASLLRAAEHGQLAGPGVLKPLSRYGGLGVRKVTPDTLPRIAGALDYAPVLWQALVSGPQVSTGVLCAAGEVIAFMAYLRRDGRLQFFDHPALRADTERLTRSLGLTGIYNFDMIADAELTRFHWLECNPRVFHTMEAMALAGLNLLALALDRPEAAADRAEAAMARLRGTWLAGPLAAVLGLARARPLNAPTRRLLVHHLSDPLAFARERVGRAARRAWPDGSGSAGVARN